MASIWLDRHWWALCWFFSALLNSMFLNMGPWKTCFIACFHFNWYNLRQTQVQPCFATHSLVTEQVACPLWALGAFLYVSSVDTVGHLQQLWAALALSVLKRQLLLPSYVHKRGLCLPCGSPGHPLDDLLKGSSVNGWLLVKTETVSCSSVPFSWYTCSLISLGSIPGSGNEQWKDHLNVKFLN